MINRSSDFSLGPRSPEAADPRDLESPKGRMRSIRVEDLLSKRFEKLDLHPIAGPGGMGRTIVSSKVQRPGKGLVTAPSSIRVNRPLIFGIKEIDLMNALAAGEACVPVPGTGAAEHPLHHCRRNLDR